jgi:single-stranded-DNA-specific exonuclease
MTFVSRDRNEQDLEKLAGYPEFLRILLWNRGIKTVEEAEAFLNPDYEKDIHDPFLLPDIEKAVKRILEAVEKKEKIVIYSDYDADGIPGGVILHDFFEKIKHENFVNYIPHRHNEGFGLNTEAVDRFKEEGVSLIITVDCGITDLAEAYLIKNHNIDLIVTDHHLPPLDKGGLREVDLLPDCVAVIDAKRKDSKYPFRDLCGAGVAYKLIQAVLKKKDFGLKEGVEKWFLDMVAIATLSDMVPLVGENRALAFYGLKVLRKSPRLGLLKLLRLLKIDQKNITEDDIGFSISPRINAASRMGNPEDAFKLFIAKTDEEADICARHLDHINNERKGKVANMVKEIRKIMADRLENNEEIKKVIVIGNPDWKPSLVGLAASSLSDDHKCSVFIWGRDGNNILKGSCRSDGSVSLVDLMSEVEKDILLDFGGHTMAGGFSVSAEKVHLLEDKLQSAYEKIIVADKVSPKPNSDEAKADSKITLDEITLENYKMIAKLAPYGVGNQKPLFLLEKLEIKNIKKFGKEVNHLELLFHNSRGRTVKAIGFFMADLLEKKKLDINQKINLLANFENSTFAGRTELRLRIVDLENML